MRRCHLLMTMLHRFSSVTKIESNLVDETRLSHRKNVRVKEEQIIEGDLVGSRDTSLLDLLLTRSCHTTNDSLE